MLGLTKSAFWNYIVFFLGFFLANQETFVKGGLWGMCLLIFGIEMNGCVCLKVTEIELFFW